MTKDDFKFCFILLLLVILPYFFIGLNNNSVLGNLAFDIANFFIPTRILGFGLLAKGILPLWNPYIFSGTPFFAESQLAIFYPPNLIHLFLPIATAINFLIIMHQLLAGIFMYLYLKLITKNYFSSLIGSAVFVLSSAFLPRILAGHLTIICTIAWIPLLFYLIHRAILEEKKNLVIFSALILSLQLFAGQAQFVFITLVGLFPYALYISSKGKKTFSLKLFFLIISLGLGLAAIQILPLFAAIQNSLRLNNSAVKQMFSLPYENIITVLCPGFFGWIRDNNWWGKWYPWEVTIYIGILPLLLSFFALVKKIKYTKFFIALFLLSLILSFGAYLPFYEKLTGFMAAFNPFRANARFLVLSVFSLSMLTALGLAEPKKEQHDKRRNQEIFYTILFASSLIFIVSLLKYIIIRLPGLWIKIFNFLISYDKIASATIFKTDPFVFISGYSALIFSLNNALTFLVLGILLFIIFLKDFLNERIRKILVLAFIIIDLWGFGFRYLTVFNVKDTYIDREVADFLKDNLGINRFAISGFLKYNSGMIDKIYSVGGYSGYVEKRYNEFINFTQGLPCDEPFFIAPIIKPSPFLGLLNLKYLLVHKGSGITVKAESPYFKQVDSLDNFDIYENSFILPKAFIVHQAEYVSGRDNVFKALPEEVPELRNTIILEEPSRLSADYSLKDSSEAEPVMLKYSINEAVIKASLNNEGYLVLSDTYTPDWEVYVDGKKERLIPADYILRAVFLSKGEHTVKFIYNPGSFRMGAIISGVFLVLICILLFKKV